jgi:hypothetical protein
MAKVERATASLTNSVKGKVRGKECEGMRVSLNCVETEIYIYLRVGYIVVQWSVLP